MGEKVSRRRFLEVAGGTIAGLVVGGVIGRLTAPAKEVTAEAAAKKYPKITFIGWRYRPDIVEDNVKFFTAYYGIPVHYEAYGSGEEYAAKMTSLFTGGGPVDVCYVRDGDAPSWVKAGWLVDVEEVAPSDKIEMYKKELSPGALEILTFDGKLYGLPYYGDVMAFIYNRRMLAEVGWTKPPETWEEVTEVCLDVKKAGLCPEPLQLTLVNIDCDLWRTWQVMTFSRGGSLFDEDNNPTWEDPNSPAYEAIEWMWEAINTHKIATTKSFSMAHEDCSAALAADPPVGFCEIVHAYELFGLNTPGHFPRSGATYEGKPEWAQALMPGKTHMTATYCRFYGMTKICKDRGKDAMEAAWQLIEFMGGKDKTGIYRVAKRWALEAGLGFHQLPLFDDPDIKESLRKWADPEIKRKQQELSRRESGVDKPYYRDFMTIAGPEIQSALANQKPLKDVLKFAADKWRELKAKG